MAFMQRCGLFVGRCAAGARSGLARAAPLAGALTLSGALALVVASAPLMGCASAKPMPMVSSPVTASELVEEGKRRGLTMANPLALDPAIVKEAREKLGTW